MKTWKIITITTLTVVAAALLVTSAVAAMGPFGGYNPFTGFGGMMGRGGMMGGYGYGYGNNNPPYAQPNQTPNNQYYQPVYPFMFGGGGCGRFGWNNIYTNTA